MSTGTAMFALHVFDAVIRNKASIAAKKESKRHESLVSQICDTSNLFLQKFAMIAQQVRDLHEMARTVV